MDKSNTRIIGQVLFVLPEHAWNYQYLKESGFNIRAPYIGNSIMFRIAREIWFKWNLPGKEIWYNKDLMANFSIIWVMDALVIPDFVRWISKNNPQSRIILFYANKVKSTTPPGKIPDTWCEKWSVDLQDCEQYGLRYAPGGGYFRLPPRDRPEPRYDVIYIGRDKGRAKTVFGLKKAMEKLGLKTYFHLTATKRYQRFFKCCYKPLLPYAKVLDLINESKAILHLVDGGQEGPTIRVLESLFHQVKLITNNIHIADYDFYDKNNIFILGKDDFSSLPDFLCLPYKIIGADILEKYYIDNFCVELLTSK